MNKLISPSAGEQTECGEEEFPLIEVPKPRSGQDVGGVPAPNTMMVYRPWTPEDVEKAIEGIPHPNGGVLPHDDAALVNRRNALIARIENRWIR